MPHDLQPIMDQLEDKRMSETEKPKPGAADIMAAIDAARAESRANDGAILKALETIMGTLATHGATLDAMRAASNGMGGRPSSGIAHGAGTGSSMTVKFGRDKGKRLDEVTDLSWYRGAIAKSVDDPSKAQYRDRNLDDLAEIDREIARRQSGANPAQAAFETQRTGGGYSDAPPAGAPPDFGSGCDDSMPF